MEQFLDYITLGIGSIAVIVIIYGVLTGLVRFVRAELRRFVSKESQSSSFEQVRHDIGFHLLLGLEFLIAADIVRSVLSPSLEELATLGGIVAIRVVLSYFLGLEVSRTR